MCIKIIKSKNRRCKKPLRYKSLFKIVSNNRGRIFGSWQVRTRRLNSDHDSLIQRNKILQSPPNVIR